MKMQRLIGIFIVIMIIIIIVISVIILNMGVSTQETEELTEIEEGSGSEEEYDYENETVEKVTSSLNFYTVSDCIDTYIERLNINSSEYDYYDEETTQLSEEEINQCIYNLLSEEYIEQNEITIDNLREKVEVFEENMIYTSLKMNVLTQDTIEEYVVYGFLTDSSLNFIKEIYFDVKVDVVNYTFSIEPISSDDYSDIDEIEIINDNQEIEENDVNAVSSVTINNEYICRKYLQTYRKIILAWPELAYEYLDDEYKELRFGSYENFTEYITDNYDNLCDLTLSKYEAEAYDEYTQYTCEDTNKNIYTFTENEAIMDFTVQLDDYTIPTDEFIELYNSATDEEKVQTDIEMFFKMINTKDYNAAYEILNNTFKESNFATVDEFKEYAQNNFFDNTTITTVNELTESGGYYVCTITTSSGSSSAAESGEETFIVSLGEGTDFEMSFTVKE